MRKTSTLQCLREALAGHVGGFDKAMLLSVMSGVATGLTFAAIIPAAQTLGGASTVMGLGFWQWVAVLAILAVLSGVIDYFKSVISYNSALDFLAIALDRVHVFDERRLGDVVLLQNPGAFHRQRPQTGGHVLDGVGLAVAGGQRILQMRVAHGCGDGVVVGVAMAHDEDFGRHEGSPFSPTYGFEAV